MNKKTLVISLKLRKPGEGCVSEHHYYVALNDDNFDVEIVILIRFIMQFGYQIVDLKFSIDNYESMQ